MGEYREAVGVEGATVAMRYTVVIEQASNNLAAYVPDLPGCVATGKTRRELLETIREAIEFHIESLRDHGEPIPDPLAPRRLGQLDGRSAECSGSGHRNLIVQDIGTFVVASDVGHVEGPVGDHCCCCGGANPRGRRS